MTKEEMAKKYAEGFTEEYREIAHSAFLCGYGAKFSTETPEDLEEAARKYRESVPVDTTIHYCGADEDVYFANRIVDAVIFGAQWQRVQMMKEAVEKKGVVWDDEFVKFDDGTFLDFRDPTLGINPAFVLPKNGEKVKVIVIKED